MEADNEDGARMEEDTECSICRCDMNALVFDSAGVEGVCAKECFRLSCKHAFHIQCLVTSLRSSGTGCPICRDGSSAAAPRNPARIYFEMEMEAPEEFPEEEEFLNRVLHALNSSNPRVMATKRTLNSSLKAYNLLRDKLRQERKKVVSVAMREFRARRHPDFVAMRQRVEQALKAYHDQIRAEVGGVDVEDLHFVGVEDMLRQSEHPGSSVRRQDPMRLSFWH